MGFGDKLSKNQLLQKCHCNAPVIQLKNFVILNEVKDLSALPLHPAKAANRCFVPTHDMLKNALSS
jgi:hypothetical protein